MPIELGVFSATTPRFEREHLFLISQDVSAGNHRFSGRFNYSRNRSVEAGELPVPAFNSSTIFDTRRVTFSDVYTISPKAVNELRFAYLRSTSGFPVDLPPAPGGTDIFANYNVNDLNLFIGPQGNFPQEDGNNIYQFVNQISWFRGRHNIKAGGDVRNIIAFSSFLPRSRGEYVWTNLDRFVRDTFPTVVSIRGVGLERFSQNRTAAYGFVQDTWKVHPRFTLELGIRYEYTQFARDSRLQDLNAIASIPSFAADPVFPTLPRRHQEALLGHLGPGITFRSPVADRNNFAPRIGLAWDLFGDGRTSFRAGFGVAQDVIFGNLPLLQLPPQVQAESRETNACSVNPAPGWCALVPPGGDPTTADAIRFSRTGFLEGGAIFPTLPPAALNDPEVARDFTQGLVLDEKSPETYTWSASLQRQLWNDWLVEARYVGNHAIHLPVQRWASAGVPLPFRLPLFVQESDALSANFRGAPTRADAIASRDLLLAPFGFGGVVTMFTPDGQSWYHGGSVMVQKRMSRGLFFNVNYTFSRTIDLIENELFTSFMNPRRPQNHLYIFEGKGLSGLHRQHKFAVSWSWELPKYRGENAFLRKAVSGWQLTGSYMAETGQPVTIISRRDLNGDFDTAGDTAFVNPAGRADTGTDVNFVCFDGAATRIAGSVAGCGGNANVVGYVAQDPNARYIRSEVGSVANLGRGTFLSPGINVWNMGIFKNTPFWGEDRFIQFRFELQNAFNHPNFIIGNGSAFNTTANATGFPGYVTPGTDQFLDKTIFSGGLGNAPFQRIIQFGLRLVF